MTKEPNHICKYRGCKLGENGTKKHYYACPDCDKNTYSWKWRAVGCCFEHAMMYQNEVAIARGEKTPFPDMLPQMVLDGVVDKKGRFVTKADTTTIENGVSSTIIVSETDSDE